LTAPLTQQPPPPQHHPLRLTFFTFSEQSQVLLARCAAGRIVRGIVVLSRNPRRHECVRGLAAKLEKSVKLNILKNSIKKFPPSKIALKILTV
jgi:hypothetical protein